MAYHITRDLNCSGTVACDGAIVCGSLTSSGPIASGSFTSLGETMLAGVAWPSAAGTPGQILTLVSSSHTAWREPHRTMRVTTASATHTISPDTDILFVNRAAGADITLPAVSNALDKSYIIVDRSGGISRLAPIVIRPASGDTIIGKSEFILQEPYNSITLVHDESRAWFLV